jgi:hypothetical protein
MTVSFENEIPEECVFNAPHAAGTPHSHAGHVAGSRVKHGAELPMMEGTGLTSSDPAFFDIAALADRATSGNQIGRADQSSDFGKAVDHGRNALLEGLKTCAPFVS